MKKLWNLLLILTLPLAFAGCGEEEKGNSEETNGETKTYSGMSGEKADLEYSIVTIKKLDGSQMEVDLNGLAVEAVKGAQKDDSGNWHVVDRRGVRFEQIFAKAGISADLIERGAVTFIGRDGYDVYRTKLKGNTDKLPEFSWLAAKGYVYLGSGGNKDPLYPLHEGKALNVDYDLADDSEVPANIGTAISALSNLRALMIEKVDANAYGLIELLPF